MIDTHTHLDGEEFLEDLPETIQRAKDAGVKKVFLPAIDLASSRRILDLCTQYPDYCYAMIGIHPEEIKADWQTQFHEIKQLANNTREQSLPFGEVRRGSLISIGEVGLDYYWSREFESEQLAAFEAHVEWSIESRLPLMIHCRKAQNEMVRLLRRYEKDLPGGVFHCFTGNEHEALELLEFQNFVLGIGGVLTFKKSNLPTTLPSVVPIDRIVLETDSPYMAPVPHRGKRNESAFVSLVCDKLAESYNLSPDEVDRITTATAKRIFNIS